MASLNTLPTGTWNIDPAHTTASFKVRHLGLTTVRGTFSGITGSAQTDDQNHLHSLHVQIPTATVNTGNADRDNHVRSADFLDVEQFPTLTFKSTKVEVEDEDTLNVTGDLTIKGQTQQVTIPFDFNGQAVDPFGNTRIGFEGKTQIKRKDFGLTWNAALETGGVLVSDDVVLELEISAIKQA